MPRGTERLRITPGPLHTDEMIETLVQALATTMKKIDPPSMHANAEDTQIAQNG